eukprot:TRINITY_DN43_c0_g2_i1.p1 TRINITY_DN43_c0_g2~~TRINITY_DN43_c0_g2_i1.p1  ORF type:complete len:444 (-),score=86.28 TRINITY_DN43_c0_g2_i1:619-1950(-)
MALQVFHTSTLPPTSLHMDYPFQTLLPSRCCSSLPGSSSRGTLFGGQLAPASANGRHQRECRWKATKRVGRICAAEGGDAKKEEAKKPWGLFNFVTDNPSSRSAEQLPNTPAQDYNVGQMMSQIEGKGREYGRMVESGGLEHWVRETRAKGLFSGGEMADRVLFLHGSPTQSYSFRNVMVQLAGKGFHSYAPDAIGYGFSDMPQPGYGFNYTEEEYHKQLDELLETLKFKAPFHLVVQGFVLGSLGLSWALKNPERLLSVGILNTPLTPSAPLPQVLSNLRLRLIGEFVSQNAVVPERFIEKGSPYVLENDDADVYRLPYLNSGAAGFSLLESVRKAPLPDLAKRIDKGFAAGNWSVPTLVAWGEKDKYLPKSEATAFAAKNPDVITAKILEGAGHMPQEDWPEKVTDALAAHFKRAASVRPPSTTGSSQSFLPSFLKRQNKG